MVHPSSRFPSGPDRPGPAAPLPRWLTVLLPVVVGVAALVGLLLPGRWSALVLLGVLAVLGWLARRSWTVLDRPGRTLRAVVLGGLAALVVVRLVG